MSVIILRWIYSRGLPGYCGKMSVSCEESSENQREHLQLNCRAEKLDKKGLFSKSDPFLKFYRLNDDGRWDFLFNLSLKYLNFQSYPRPQN